MLNEVATSELIEELASRGLFTSSPTNLKVLQGQKEKKEIKLIATYGARSRHGQQECRECRQMRPDKDFSYYQARVNHEGFLSRSNALCKRCIKKSNKQRKEVLDNAKIPPRPKNGSPCSHCKRGWSGNWHRHHVGDRFMGWLCGHCNMSFSDQRNKNA